MAHLLEVDIEKTLIFQGITLDIIGKVNMDSILIKDTTREERERIVAESIGNIDGSCDGCSAGLIEMYQPYIDGVKEIREINMEFRAHYESGIDGPVKKECEYRQ